MSVVVDVHKAAFRSQNIFAVLEILMSSLCIYVVIFTAERSSYALASLYCAVCTSKHNKVASFKRSQCEGCSIIIYLMALYDYYLKCIEGRHIKDIF